MQESKLSVVNTRFIRIRFVMAARDETEDSVAFALPDCEILCAICNQSSHLDIKRTQQMCAT